MSEWTLDERRNLLQKMERIATVLEERLPPLSECNENERLRARVNEYDHRLLAEQRMRLDADSQRAELIAERDHLLIRARDVLTAHKFKGSGSSEFYDAMDKLWEVVGKKG